MMSGVLHFYGPVKNKSYSLGLVFEVKIYSCFTLLFFRKLVLMQSSTVKDVKYEIPRIFWGKK